MANLPEELQRGMESLVEKHAKAIHDDIDALIKKHLASHMKTDVFHSVAEKLTSTQMTQTPTKH